MVEKGLNHLNIKFVKVAEMTHPLNWWNNEDIIGETFEVLEVSVYGYVKIEYYEKYFGWLPLDVCEVNPHLRIVK